MEGDWAEISEIFKNEAKYQAKTTPVNIKIIKTHQIKKRKRIDWFILFTTKIKIFKILDLIMLNELKKKSPPVQYQRYWG